MDSPTAQNMRDTLQQGPVAENIKNETAKTSQEFDNLAHARVKPETTAATGQELTHYHSMFYSLFSWENPRATAAIFLATVSFIFAARYLHIVRYAFKGAYMILGGKATILLRANGICRANFGPTVSAASELLGRGFSVMESSAKCVLASTEPSHAMLSSKPWKTCRSSSTFSSSRLSVSFSQRTSTSPLP